MRWISCWLRESLRKSLVSFLSTLRREAAQVCPRDSNTGRGRGCRARTMPLMNASRAPGWDHSTCSEMACSNLMFRAPSMGT